MRCCDSGRMCGPAGRSRPHACHLHSQAFTTPGYPIHRASHTASQPLHIQQQSQQQPWPSVAKRSLQPQLQQPCLSEAAAHAAQAPAPVSRNWAQVTLAAAAPAAAAAALTAAMVLVAGLWVGSAEQLPHSQQWQQQELKEDSLSSLEQQRHMPRQGRHQGQGHLHSRGGRQRQGHTHRRDS